MKRSFLIGLFILVVGSFLGVASAEHMCPDDQVMFRLYNADNSHGALWDDTEADYEVCHSDIFGNDYVGGNPHACNGNNKIIKLASVSNSHAESPEGTIYPVDVCYGNLECVYSSAGSCPAGKTEVVSLSASTNAHISASGQYNNKICCTSLPGPPSGEIDSAYWANFTNEDIPIDRGYKECWVQLVATTSTIYNGGTINYEITENDGISSDDIKELTAVVKDGVAKAAWKIDDAAIEAAGEEDNMEFYFTATFGGSVGEGGLLNVNIDELCPRGHPTVQITSPEHRQIYFKNTELVFSQESSSPNSPIIEWNWTIEDENSTKDVQILSEGFNYTFITSGQKTITIRVKDAQGEYAYDQASILVVGSPNILAYVNKPFHKEKVVIPRDDPSARVSYNANDSYVTDTIINQGNGCGSTVECLAGNCPSETKNVPPGCTSRESIPVNNPQQGFENLNFTWAFKVGSNSEDSITSGFGKFSGEQEYNTAGDKLINLLLNYTDNSKGISVQALFQREFSLLWGRDNWACSESRNEIFRIEDGIEIESYDTSVYCGFGESVECCPDRSDCTENGCVPSNVGSCSGYSTESSCSGDTSNVAETGGPISRNECQAVKNGCASRCFCYWDADSDLPNGGTCRQEQDSAEINTGESCVPGGVVSPLSCAWDTEDIVGGDTCDENGKKMVTIKGKKISGDGECLDRVAEIPCGRALVALPFFGGINVLIVVLIIILIYFLLSKRKGKKRR